MTFREELDFDDRSDVHGVSPRVTGGAVPSILTGLQRREKKKKKTRQKNISLDSFVPDDRTRIVVLERRGGGRPWEGRGRMGGGGDWYVERFLCFKKI